jgi:serine/threonine protein phosphatase 1
LLWNALISPVQRQKPSLPSGIRIYAVGDIHGRLDLLTEVFARIDASLEHSPVSQPVEVFLGDYIDRGSQSREVIETLIARRRKRTIVLLKGNHESYALQFLKDPSILSEWEHAGGTSTLLSYGVRLSTRRDPRKDEDVAVAFVQALPRNHRCFIEGLALTFTCGDYFFVHAGVRPGIPVQRQWERDLLWIRDEFLLCEEDFGKTVVHGHTPTKEPDIRHNRINIDTGAYATGRLTCLILQGEEMALL